MLTARIDPKQLSDLRAKLDPKKFKQAIDIALFNISREMQREAVGKARHRKGALKGSIQAESTSEYAKIGTNLTYAKIHEFGGTITAKNSPYLHFQINGNWVRVGSVTITPQPYMRPALETQRQGRAIKVISEEINKLL